jgi:hypothetical protein
MLPIKPGLSVRIAYGEARNMTDAYMIVVVEAITSIREYKTKENQMH